MKKLLILLCILVLITACVKPTDTKTIKAKPIIEEQNVSENLSQVTENAEQSVEPNQQSVVTKTECDDCQYLEDGECKFYECCSDMLCPGTHECRYHKCVEIECGSCEYAKSHKCVDYQCCEDEDCKDMETTGFRAVCNKQGTKYASCKTVPIGDSECDVDQDCDDDKAWTRDLCKGDEHYKQCFNYQIQDCKNNDGYCPDGCTKSNDNDCEPEKVDCGTNFNCFIEASEDCNKAEVEYTTSVELFGSIITPTTYMEIIEQTGSFCNYQQETIGYEIEYTDSTVQSLLDSNMTQTEIDQQLQEANENAQEEVIGRKVICENIFSPSELAAMFNDWNVGTMSTSDLEDCDMIIP